VANRGIRAPRYARLVRQANVGDDRMTLLLCSQCFHDQGLRLDATRLGDDNEAECPKCGSTPGKKLDQERLEDLAHRSFVHGTVVRPKFGGYPGLQFEDHQTLDDMTKCQAQTALRVVDGSIECLGVDVIQEGAIVCGVQRFATGLTSCDRRPAGPWPAACERPNFNVTFRNPWPPSFAR
jgi:hypothetical protein